MTLVTLCNLMLSLLLCWTESSITWLPRDSCLSGTKSKDSNAPLPTPAANPPSSTIFGHTPCRTAHEIHNQKPTHHHTATNFRAWDPMPKIKSQIQIHRKWIQNQNAYSDWPIKDPQTQIPNFWLTHSDHKHKSQPIYHQDLPWKWERERLRDEMNHTSRLWSWMPLLALGVDHTSFESQPKNTKSWVRGKDWNQGFVKRILSFDLEEGHFGLLTWCYLSKSHVWVTWLSFPSNITSNLNVGVQSLTNVIVYCAKRVFEKFRV